MKPMCACLYVILMCVYMSVRLCTHSHVTVCQSLVCLSECVCVGLGMCIVLGAEVLPVYHGTTSFLPHISSHWRAQGISHCLRFVFSPSFLFLPLNHSLPWTPQKIHWADCYSWFCDICSLVIPSPGPQRFNIHVMSVWAHFLCEKHAIARSCCMLSNNNKALFWKPTEEKSHTQIYKINKSSNNCKPVSEDNLRNPTALWDSQEGGRQQSTDI